MNSRSDLSLRQNVRIMSFDSEDDSRGNPFLFNFYDGVNHFTFFTIEEVAQFLSTLKGNFQIWCTNLQYDFNNLIKDLGHAIEINYSKSKVISARLRGSNIFFKCTLNHWDLSVEAMGQRIGLKKLGVDIQNLKSEFRRNPKKVIRYCQRDCEITYHFVVSMKKQYDEIGCDLKSTIGSTSLNYFYKNFWHRPKPEEILPTSQIDFCRKGFYGGRTEIFHNRPISGHIQYFDFNSLYPSIMEREVYPNLDNRRWTKRPNFENEGMVDVEVVSPDMQIPYLPCRIKKRGLLFPVGKFRGIYTYFEIRMAIELGYKIVKVHEALEFSGYCRPFQRFVETLYKRRLKAQAEGDDLMSDSCKLIMNNLFGKFGQGKEFTKLLSIDDASKLKNGDEILGDFVLRKAKSDYAFSSNGIWPCYVTAYGRDKVFRALTRVADKGGLLIYTDTDSIIFESNKRIITPSNRLGELKLVSEFEYVHFKLPKLYKVKDKEGNFLYKAKGVPNKPNSPYAGEFFESGKTSFRRPYKLREALRRSFDQVEDARDLNPKKTYKIIPNFWDITSKEIRKKYDKRIVKKNGSTEPIRLG